MFEASIILTGSAFLFFYVSKFFNSKSERIEENLEKVEMGNSNFKYTPFNRILNSFSSIVYDGMHFFFLSFSTYTISASLIMTNQFILSIGFEGDYLNAFVRIAFSILTLFTIFSTFWAFQRALKAISLLDPLWKAWRSDKW